MDADLVYSRRPFADSTLLPSRAQPRIPSLCHGTVSRSHRSDTTQGYSIVDELGMQRTKSQCV
eukprot:6207293-Pleurochrysis_carterae.AAC.1